MDVGRPPTPFEQRVFDTICRIPRGKVTTYGLLAKELDCGSAQAVGQALKRNPFAPEVPCHRVIASDLKTGGFSGQRKGATILKKLRLLREEGVAFQDGRLADESVVWDFNMG
ncbi:MAG: methylated-DNA-[protein]-cysteine S-methyltransferase [Verrucomicrobiales bacterium]|jgi:methylated-DNA-[protein]-cysteine S-methyltransferase